MLRWQGDCHSHEGSMVVVDGRRLEDDTARADKAGCGEDPEEEAIQNKCHVLPVFTDLKQRNIRICILYDLTFIKKCFILHIPRFVYAIRQSNLRNANRGDTSRPDNLVLFGCKRPSLLVSTIPPLYS